VELLESGIESDIVKYMYAGTSTHCKSLFKFVQHFLKLKNAVQDKKHSISSEIEYEALNVYRSLSCSLFLTFHPEIGAEDQEVTQLMTELPKIMIGYCKVPCDYINFNPDQRFINSYPQKLRILYLNQSTSNPIPQEADHQGLQGMTAGDFIQGLRNIPITTDYLPEIFATLSLFALQVYIVIQVCQNRAKAI